MTAATVPPAVVSDGPGRGHRRPVLLGAAALVAVLVVVLVLTFGVVRPPSLPSIADEPAVTPPAELALLRYDRGDTCLTIVATDGATREPWCSEGGGEVVGWDAEGVLVTHYGPNGDAELTIDPVDGQVLDSRSVAFDERREPTGADRPVTSSRGGDRDELTVRADGGTVLWRTTTDEAYEVTGGWPSPDGEAFVLRDTAGRLLLVPADGSEGPRVWAEDLESWGAIAWQGSTPS